ncbi:MAG TPA: type II toxin-antitoxin system HipA family toxin [Acidimicrobiia bacterium]|nr:type II toxin-antitoxin system HipA family toxin [Acidimicrobiia bacterium]
MSPDTVIVAIEGTVAGTLTRTRSALRFEYDDAYRATPGATPLSVSMPVQVRTHTDAKVAPWLRGLLPDDSQVLDRWARHFRVRTGSAFELLTAPVGEDCAGAVQFARPERIEAILKRPGSIDWLDEGAIAARLRDLRYDTSAWLGSDFTGQWSLAGAQAKTALRYENGRWGEPGGAAATTHILKPAITGLDDHDLNEHLCLAAARAAGLRVVLTHIEQFEDQSAVVVERYDRAWRDGDLIRVHQEDLCQALGVAPAQKYESDGGPSAASIVELFREAMSPDVAADATSRFVDALAWNWIIAGTDAHAKNYSILHRGDQVRLAPLYDIASALAYPDMYVPKLKLAMTLGGEYQLKAHGHRNWERTADQLSLDPESVVARVRELARRAPHAFSDVARVEDVRRIASALPGRLVDAVAERAEHCLAML